MALQEIGFLDKETLKVSPAPEINKLTATNVNEIKNVVNENKNNVVDIDNFISEALRDQSVGKAVFTDDEGKINKTLRLPFSRIGRREYDVGDNPGSSPGTGRVKMNADDLQNADTMVFHNLDIETLKTSELYNAEFGEGSYFWFRSVSTPNDAMIFKVTGTPVISPSAPIVIFPIAFVSASGNALPEWSDATILDVYAMGGDNLLKELDQRRTIQISTGVIEYVEILFTPFEIYDRISGGISAVTYSAWPDDGTTSEGDPDTAQNVDIDTLNNYIRNREKPFPYYIKTIFPLTIRDSAIQRTEVYV